MSYSKDVGEVSALPAGRRGAIGDVPVGYARRVHRPGLGQQRPVRPVRVELDILPRLPRTAVSEEALTES